MKKNMRLKQLFALIPCGAALWGCVNLAQTSPTVQQTGKPGKDRASSERPDDAKLREGAPNPKVFTSRPDLLAAARATKDSNRILAALDRELKGDPNRFDLRQEQAQTFERMGRKAEAKEAYSSILWPGEGASTSLSTDLRVVERYLTLCESSNDRQGAQKAIDRAIEVLSQNPRNLPAKRLTLPAEVRAAIAFNAYREAKNAEKADEAAALLQKAVAKDPAVALYKLHYGRDLSAAALALANSQEDPKAAIAKWQEAKAVLEQAMKVAVRTKQDDVQLDAVLYDVNNYIEMAKHGFFKGAAAARKKAGGPTYSVVPPPAK